ncbi:MAG TPA: alkaline phosphatase family protein, partial [Candidatus Dormibacteraeota bacterium]
METSAGDRQPRIPRYGVRSLADLSPALLGSQGSAIEIEDAPRVCLLLVDGLGSELLHANRAIAPFMNSLAQEPLTTGFPATTAASISSLATGLPPGQHGLLGYTMALPGQSRAFNTLTWSLYGIGPRVSLLDAFVPEHVQAEKTMVERAVEQGRRVTRIGPGAHDGSGLSRAVWRAGEFRAAETLEAVLAQSLGALQPANTFVYAYHPKLDSTGHVQGVASQAWRDELGSIERSLVSFAERLPRDCLL